MDGVLTACLISVHCRIVSARLRCPRKERVTRHQEPSRVVGSSCHAACHAGRLAVDVWLRARAMGLDVRDCLAQCCFWTEEDDQPDLCDEIVDYFMECCCPRRSQPSKALTEKVLASFNSGAATEQRGLLSRSGSSNCSSTRCVTPSEVGSSSPQQVRRKVRKRRRKTIDVGGARFDTLVHNEIYWSEM